MQMVVKKLLRSKILLKNDYFLRWEKDPSTPLVGEKKKSMNLISHSHSSLTKKIQPQVNSISIKDSKLSIHDQAGVEKWAAAAGTRCFLPHIYTQYDLLPAVNFLFLSVIHLFPFHGCVCVCVPGAIFQSD